MYHIPRRKAREYEDLKMRLASLYADDRKSYTAGKETMIERLLREAVAWKTRTRVNACL